MCEGEGGEEERQRGGQALLHSLCAPGNSSALAKALGDAAAAQHVSDNNNNNNSNRVVVFIFS